LTLQWCNCGKVFRVDNGYLRFRPILVIRVTVVPVEKTSSSLFVKSLKCTQLCIIIYHVTKNKTITTYRLQFNSAQITVMLRGGFMTSSKKCQISRLSGHCVNTAPKTVKIWNFVHTFAPQGRLVCKVFTKFTTFVHVYS